MIVKDEEMLLGRVLDSASPVCDEMVVVDTGSSDRTVEVAREHGATVQEVPWRDDFATARNAVMAWCEGDWVLTLDADDVVPPPTVSALAGLKEFLADKADYDVVLGPHTLRYGQDDTVLLSRIRERLVRRVSGLRWEGRVCEVLPIPRGRSAFVPELVVQHRPSAARSRDNRARNLRALQRELESGHPDVRARFNYALELYSGERVAEASAAFEAYVHNDRNPDSPDRYWALVGLAECSRILGDTGTLRSTALTAIGEDPGRPEAYITLARHYYDTEAWDRAVPLYLAATAGRRPPWGYMRDPDYQYLAWDYLSVCLDRLGRHEESLEASKRALKGNPEADRVKANMRWSVENL